MPSRAISHIQKMAPGPPRVNATATPTMLPTPTREASEIENAWNDEIPPLTWPRELKMTFHIVPNRRNWTPLVITVKATPAAIRKKINTHVRLSLRKAITASMRSLRSVRVVEH